MHYALSFLLILSIWGHASAEVIPDGKTAKPAAQVPTVHYYYHWSHKEGKPHPEDLILRLEYKQGVGLEVARLICTSDEYDIKRKDYLPGFWMLSSYVGGEKKKVADGIYTLEFYTSGDMIYDHPFDARYQKNEDAWKSGKYQIWRYTSKARPRLMTYTLSVGKDNTASLSGNGRPTRRFVRMERAQVIALDRNTYDAQQLASNRKVNPVNDPRVEKRLSHQTINYPDSSCYEGAVEPTNDGRYIPHGQGRKAWKSGMVYEGDWVHGTPNGKGILTWPSGARYEGDFDQNGDRTGQGSMTYSEGDTYQGGFLRGDRHGHGTYRGKSGYTYEGDYVQGKKSGHGKEYLPDVDGHFEGEFADGKRNGHGTMSWGDKNEHPGTSYEGQWEDGWRTGQGTYRYADGHTESGRWERNNLVEPDEQTQQMWDRRQKEREREITPEMTASRIPTFPDGNNALTYWLNRNLRYPKSCAKEGIGGRVMVGFTVDTEGNVSDPHIVRSAHPKLDQEVLRLIKKMPRMLPALDRDGNPMNFRMVLPVLFGNQDNAGDKEPRGSISPRIFD